MKKKPKFPTMINLLGRKWKIKQVQSLVMEDKILLGLCDWENKIIFLSKNQSDDEKFSTLVHEVAHAWLIFCGLDQKMSESEVEVNCQLIAALVEDIIRAFN